MSASQHRVATLSSCPPPDTVGGLRSFTRAYKALSRVLPNCSQLLAPLDQIISGKESRDAIQWTDTSLVLFHAAQHALKEHKSITLPRPSDQLWIVADGSVAKSGIGATLYVNRDSKLQLVGFFSAKLRKHQVTWLPCEIEALSIAASIKHFSPYIIQLVQPTCLLTDSKPCVQAVQKLCPGEFSASPRVTSFLSIVSRYAVQVQHLGECLISLQIFQAPTLPNVPSYVAKSANSSRRLKIPSFVQRLFKIFETFHICHLQRDPSGMRFRVSVPTSVAPMPT